MVVDDDQTDTVGTTTITEPTTTPQIKTSSSLDDCCAFLNLGALAVSDILFLDEEGDYEDEDDDDGTHSGKMVVLGEKSSRKLRRRKNERLIGRKLLLADGGKKRLAHEEEEDDTTMKDVVEGDDDTCTLTYDDRTMLTNDDTLLGEEFEKASRCDQTITDISLILSNSKLSCSRYDEREDDHDHVMMVSDDDDSNVQSMKTAPSLFDEEEDDEEERDAGGGDEGLEVVRHVEFQPEDVSPLTKHPLIRLRRRRNSDADDEVADTHTTSFTVQRRVGAPYQLRRLLTRGPKVQHKEETTPLWGEEEMECLEQEKTSAPKSPSRLLFGATSRKYHHQIQPPSSVPSTRRAYETSIMKKDSKGDDIPFDEPLWYR